MTTEFIDIKKVIEEFDREAATWRKERVIGDVKHDIKHKYISIVTPNGGEYDIGLDRVTTPAEALHWLCHMTEKSWFTPQMTYDLIKVIKRVTTINEYCCPDIWENGKKHDEDRRIETPGIPQASVDRMDPRGHQGTGKEDQRDGG